MEHRDCKGIYIGKLIQNRVNELGLTYAEFARRIHSSRTNLYRLFNSKSIDVERLLLISDVLDYDFIHEVYFLQPEVTANLILPIKNGMFHLEHLPLSLRNELKKRL